MSKSVICVLSEYKFRHQSCGQCRYGDLHDDAVDDTERITFRFYGDGLRSIASALAARNHDFQLTIARAPYWHARVLLPIHRRCDPFVLGGEGRWRQRIAQTMFDYGRISTKIWYGPAVHLP